MRVYREVKLSIRKTGCMLFWIQNWPKRLLGRGLPTNFSHVFNVLYIHVYINICTVCKFCTVDADRAWYVFLKVGIRIDVLTWEKEWAKWFFVLKGLLKSQIYVHIYFFVIMLYRQSIISLLFFLNLKKMQKLISKSKKMWKLVQS